MAPTLITSPSSPLGLTILPRTACHELHGCGSIQQDKLPLIIAVVVVVVIIIVAIYWFSFRKLREIRKQQTSTTKDNVKLAIVLGLNPNNTAPHAPTLGAGTTTGATTGSGATGTGTGAGTGAIGARGGAGGAAAGQPGVFEGGLPPLVPPPLYEETPPPPPTYQRGEMAPRRA
ncbi:hypothetical protein B0H65DRAFT_551069 [Neurospora tetraspora]|uniref:Uncharacterized protein n=1 Tax=Neurospora tetraspora TaxID=94610 RepID=A0AAE0JB50_9PEZI|nr:hypothetical protein B0H65DRAFT_551069 [Neurospora tetraspora]